MGFFSDLGKKTTETTGKIARETKLKLKINENKGEIEDIYEEIGKKVYEKHVREEKVDINVDLANECGIIDSLAKEIEDAKLEILKLNQKKLCSKCSAEIENGAMFCPKCGEKQNPEENIVKEDVEEKTENVETLEENKQETEIIKEENEQNQ